MWQDGDAVLVYLADEGALAVHAVVVVEDDGVDAGGDANTDDLGEAARIGNVKRTDVVRFGINKAAWTEAEAACRKVPIADAELVLVASDGVALGKGRHRKGNEQTENDEFGFHNDLNFNSLNLEF